MMDDEPLTAVARTLVPGGQLVRTEALAGGVSATVVAMDIRAPSGDIRRVVLRQHGATTWKELEQDVTAVEFGVQSALHRIGFPVPEPLHLDDSGAVLSSPSFIMAYIEGTTHVSEPDRLDAVCRMAEVLARLHGLDPSTLALPGLPPRVDPVPDLLRLLPAFLEDQRDALAARVGTTEGPTVLLHGDFWPGNILWQDGSLVAVLDWEDTALGDPRSDLAAARLELLWRYGEPAMRRFAAHYLECVPIEIDLDGLPLWELHVAAGANASMEHWGLAPDVEARMREQTRAYMRDAMRRLPG